MDKQTDNEPRQEGTFEGYATPGTDRTLESDSPAVPSPLQPSEERLEAPKPVIESTGDKPGEANPALAETIGAQTDQVSTADLLRTREASEEEYLREAGAHVGQDHMGGLRPDEYQDRDEGRPNWPNDRRESPLDYMDAPRADMPLGSGSADKVDVVGKARIDAAVDRSSTQASAGESRSGLPHAGLHADEDKYEEREFERPTPPSETEMFAPNMRNLPDDEDTGNG